MRRRTGKIIPVIVQAVLHAKTVTKYRMPSRKISFARDNSLYILDRRYKPRVRRDMTVVSNAIAGITKSTLSFTLRIRVDINRNWRKK
jgi:hypothetical protein